MLVPEPPLAFPPQPSQQLMQVMQQGATGPTLVTAVAVPAQQQIPSSHEHQQQLQLLQMQQMQQMQLQQLQMQQMPMPMPMMPVQMVAAEATVAQDMSEDMKKRSRKSGSTVPRWSAEEEERLKAIISTIGDKDWTMISDQLGTGRSNSGVEQHWQIMTGKRKRDGKTLDQEEEMDAEDSGVKVEVRAAKAEAKAARAADRVEKSEAKLAEKAEKDAMKAEREAIAAEKKAEKAAKLESKKADQAEKDAQKEAKKDQPKKPRSSYLIYCKETRASVQYALLPCPPAPLRTCLPHVTALLRTLPVTAQRPIVELLYGLPAHPAPPSAEVSICGSDTSLCHFYPCDSPSPSPLLLE